MIVYGKRRKKYVLSQTSVSQDYDGAIYSVPGNPDILVKIYQPEYCTPETEKMVIDTANGKCSMLGEFPVDVVYANGRFAGYIFEQSVPAAPVDIQVETPPPTRSGMSTAVSLILCIAAGMVLSALIFFVVFGALESIIGGAFCRWNFDGIPMIIGGWCLMMFAYLQFRDRGAQAVVVGIAAFLLGAAVVFGLISMIVWMLNLAWTLTEALLPTILTIVIVVWILKMLLGRR